MCYNIPSAGCHFMLIDARRMSSLLLLHGQVASRIASVFPPSCLQTFPFLYGASGVNIQNARQGRVNEFGFLRVFVCASDACEWLVILPTHWTTTNRACFLLTT